MVSVRVREGHQVALIESVACRARSEPPATAPLSCGASGWRLYAGCADRQGRAVCPMCAQPVGTQPGAVAGRSVRVIQQHLAS
jgi:hypothetical protein